jgi:hypothetical protein
MKHENYYLSRAGQKLLPIPQHKAFPSGVGIKPTTSGPAGYSSEFKLTMPQETITSFPKK